MTKQPTTRARITESDALYIGFLTKFPAADAEALSYLATRKSNPFGASTDELVSPSGLEKRLQKLVKLGAITRYRNPISGVRHYGATALGREAALFYEHESTNWTSMAGISISRLEHYRNIALVAAQFASPINYFKDTLGIEAVKFDSLISENEMRKPYDSVRQLLKKKLENGEGSGSFGNYRTALIKRIVEDIQAEKLEYGEITSTYPQLLTIGTIENEASKMKPIHQPDMALRLDDTHRSEASPKGKNWLIEVELSQKSPEEYERILRTIRHEISIGTAYERAIYFTGTKAIANALKRIDTAAETNLIASKRLMIMPIMGRDKTHRSTTKRITVPEEQPATVPESEELPNLDEFLSE